jgi:hypothetical protein
MATARMNFIGNIKSPPVWAADFGGREHIELFPAKIDASAFVDEGGIKVTAAATSADATSITVTALALPINPLNNNLGVGNVLIPKGTTLHFGGKKFATLTADAVLGATSLTVSAIPTAIDVGDVAYYSKHGTKYIKSGKLVGRTLAERDAGTAFGPAAVTDDEIFLTLFDVADANVSDDIELYRHRSTVKENYLPDYTTLSTAADEVQTINIDTIMSGGTISITALSSAGISKTVKVAYNTSWTQTVADIQTALIAALGTAAVACAVVTTNDMTITFSGAGYTGKAQPLVEVDVSAATGPTTADVTRTTAGGTPLLTILRSLYRCIKGQD